MNWHFIKNQGCQTGMKKVHGQAIPVRIRRKLMLESGDDRQEPKDCAGKIPSQAQEPKAPICSNGTDSSNHSIAFEM